MQNKLLIISFISLFILVPSVKGQKLVNSPYSRFNIGTINPAGSFRSLSMGGTGIAMRDNNTIYFANPASYSSIDTTSFIFDFGMDYSINKLSNEAQSYSSNDMNFNHLLMAFPTLKGWGFALGVIPVSNGSYNLTSIVDVGDPGYDPLTGKVTSYHKGSGGFTDFFLGTGINITKNLSAGVNMNVLFGNVQRINQYDFADAASTFNQISVEKLRINGINLDYGLQYSLKMKKDYFFTAGLSLTAAKNYHSNIEKLSVRSAQYVYPPYSPDTLSYINSNSRDSTRFPLTMRFGLSFGKREKFVVGIDYIYSDWANARIYGSESGLASTKALLMGIEYIPDKYSNTSYLSTIEYRLGSHFSNDYFIINGEQIKDWGLSCGLGLRLRNTPSRINLYFDYTRKNANISKGLHNEDIYSIGISLNLYDWWFMKRKYE